MKLLDITLQIYRYKQGEQPHYDTFTVQVEDTAHVIDAIDKVWAEHDLLLLSVVPATIPRVVLALCALMVLKSFPVLHVLARWEMETFRCGLNHCAIFQLSVTSLSM